MSWVRFPLGAPFTFVAQWLKFMKCESCGNKHDGKYGSGRFCCTKCARGFSSKEKRSEINAKVSKKLKANTLAGYTLSSEARTKISLANKGKMVSNETRLKQSLAQKKRKRKNRSEIELKAQNKAKVYRYRARKYNAVDGTQDNKLILLIYEKCPENYEVDHIIPISKGGKHHQNNLQYLESRENKVKGNREKYDKSKAISWQSILLA